ncbi:ABC transporter ATP-binding protein [Bordetella sp. N]|uniref:dipeptide ABC transporter ATP-binding protein n=1 Tax=Bordetella sp. N TaxID=1746199 RepID=UPI00070F0FB8|nr:ABC transporter ATP-binding protein [Bordetella sp. N]ALM84080.1 ABC transporter ATP-binding protein [Bordetella sp. N]
MATDNILAIENLHVRYGDNEVLHGVDLVLPRGESIGVVGESGSGKSTVAWTVLGLLPPGGRATAGHIVFDGEDILPAEAAAALRGDRIAMVFQDPFTALNPSIPVGRQITEVLIERGRMDGRAARAEALRLMDEVRLPRAAELLDAYPHQLSGGMKQRIVIATALACSPELLLLDEPTTALDVTVEARILDLLDELRRQRGLSLLFISHNIGLVERMCSRVTVMHNGCVQESGPAGDVLWRPTHPYTRKLLAALPRMSVTRSTAEAGTEAAVAKAAAVAPSPPLTGPADIIASATDVRLTFRRTHPLGGWARLLRLPQRAGVHALAGVTLALRPREIVGLVGESGSGKSTLGRVLVGLQPPDAGEVRLSGHDVYVAEAALARTLRRRSQMVFQNPDSSLNPRHRVGDVLRRPLQLMGLDAAAQQRRMGELLELVRLPASYASRYPHQLSGGEKQRIGIARTLALDPSVLVCDEATSALDVSVQAAILTLLKDLRDRLGVAMLFISHDLAVVSQIADRVVVMRQGAIVEQGPAAKVLSAPSHEYTRLLLDSVPPFVSGRAREVAMA